MKHQGVLRKYGMLTLRGEGALTSRVTRDMKRRSRISWAGGSGPSVCGVPARLGQRGQDDRAHGSPLTPARTGHRPLKEAALDRETWS